MTFEPDHALTLQVGPMNVMTPCALISAVLCFCFIPVKSVASLIVLAVLYGFFSGTFVSSPTATVVRLSSHSRGNIGTRLGQCFGAVSFGLLIGMQFLISFLIFLIRTNSIKGTPVGGVVLDKHGFSGLWIFAGALTAASGCLVIVSRLFYVGSDLMKKA
jgi:MFS family permease